MVGSEIGVPKTIEELRLWRLDKAIEQLKGEKPGSFFYCDSLAIIVKPPSLKTFVSAVVGRVVKDKELSLRVHVFEGGALTASFNMDEVPWDNDSLVEDSKIAIVYNPDADKLAL